MTLRSRLLKVTKRMRADPAPLTVVLTEATAERPPSRHERTNSAALPVLEIVFDPAVVLWSCRHRPTSSSRELIRPIWSDGLEEPHVIATRRSLGPRLARLENRLRDAPRTDDAVLDRLRADPTVVMTAAGMTPDAWQQQVLRTDASQMLLLCGRQMGKSSVSAALALSTALLHPGAPVLLLSPSERQSGELFRKVADLYDALGRPVPTLSRTVHRLELANGSRILSLPGTEKTVRCFSGVALLVIDEAARVDDALYFAVRPMLAVSGGRLVALSTPYGKRGWFHDEWFGTGAWERVRITAEECPRIPREFLAEERRSLGERYYRQEYMTDFTECIDAVFSYADIMAARSNDIQPLFPSPKGVL